MTETGAFFFANPDSWRRPVEEYRVRKSGKVQIVPALDHYYLEEILHNGGWQVLRESLTIDNNPSKISIVGIKIIKGISMLEQLENVLNPESLLALFMGELDI